MIRSMTGYGRSQQLLNGRDIQVEVKAVNHRFFEFSARVPRSYGYLEEKLKGLFQSRVSRGKVEVGVFIQTVEGPSAEVSVNQELAAAYAEALRSLSQPLNLPDDLTLSSMARFPDIFTVRRITEDEEQIWNDVRQVALEALESFVAMREREGERLTADLLGRLDEIGRLVEKVEERSPQTVAEYREKLYQRISEVLGDRQVDEQRILTEAAIFADRVAVAEETVRLSSHLHQFRQILQESEPVGRKLDFLVQEFNREANTIGSKVSDVELARTVVAIKSEIEKIREQIQNIE